MTDLCTCHQPAIHRRQIDGKMYSLCGECNAVLECIRQNFMGMSVLKAVRIQTTDENDTFLKMASMEPIIYKPEAAPAAVAPQPKAQPMGNVQYDPFIPPLPDHYHETLRKPPELPDDEEEEGQEQDQDRPG